MTQQGNGQGQQGGFGRPDNQPASGQPSEGGQQNQSEEDQDSIEDDEDEEDTAPGSATQQNQQQGFAGQGATEE